jgi:hypothetical protein
VLHSVPALQTDLIWMRTFTHLIRAAYASALPSLRPSTFSPLYLNTTVGKTPTLLNANQGAGLSTKAIFCCLLE